MESNDLNIVIIKAMDLAVFLGNKSGCVPLQEFELLMYESLCRMLETYSNKIRRALEEGESEMK